MLIVNHSKPNPNSHSNPNPNQKLCFLANDFAPKSFLCKNCDWDGKHCACDFAPKPLLFGKTARTGPSPVIWCNFVRESAMQYSLRSHCSSFSYKITPYDLRETLGGKNLQCVFLTSVYFENCLFGNCRTCCGDNRPLVKNCQNLLPGL